MSRNFRWVFWRMVEEGSHKEVIMGSYADWQMVMRPMKNVVQLLHRLQIGRRAARRFDLSACVHAQAGPRVRLPQAAGTYGQTRTRFSRPLINIPPSHIEQARPPSTPSAPRLPPAVG